MNNSDVRLRANTKNIRRLIVITLQYESVFFDANVRSLLRNEPIDRSRLRGYGGSAIIIAEIYKKLNPNIEIHIIKVGEIFEKNCAQIFNKIDSQTNIVIVGHGDTRKKHICGDDIQYYLTVDAYENEYAYNIISMFNRYAVNAKNGPVPFLIELYTCNATYFFTDPLSIKLSESGFNVIITSTYGYVPRLSSEKDAYHVYMSINTTHHINIFYKWNGMEYNQIDEKHSAEPMLSNKIKTPKRLRDSSDEQRIVRIPRVNDSIDSDDDFDKLDEMNELDERIMKVLEEFNNDDGVSSEVKKNIVIKRYIGLIKKNNLIERIIRNYPEKLIEDDIPANNYVFSSMDRRLHLIFRTKYGELVILNCFEDVMPEIDFETMKYFDVDDSEIKKSDRGLIRRTYD